MTRAAAVLALTLALLGGCAAPPTEGTVVAAAPFTQQVVPGRTTRAELLAAFGPTRSVVFDSGRGGWMYETAAGAGRHTEWVLLLDRDGVVRKLRRGPTRADVGK